MASGLKIQIKVSLSTVTIIVFSGYKRSREDAKSKSKGCVVTLALSLYKHGLIPGEYNRFFAYSLLCT